MSPRTPENPAKYDSHPIISGIFILRRPTPDEENELFHSMIESYEAEEEKQSLIQNNESDRGMESAATKSQASITDETYAADQPPADLTTPSVFMCCFESHCNRDPDYCIKETLTKPKFYVLYLVILTLSLVSVQFSVFHLNCAMNREETYHHSLKIQVKLNDVDDA